MHEKTLQHQAELCISPKGVSVLQNKLTHTTLKHTEKCMNKECARDIILYPVWIEGPKNA